MSSITRITPTPSRLKWWEWGNIAGILGLVALGVSFLAEHIPHPIVAALIMHVAADFSLQSDETAAQKRDRGHHLLVHALIAGGLPLALAGVAAGSPTATLVWIIVGAISHYAIDWTRKFGIRRPVPAALVDQACHVIIVLLLTLPGA